MVIKKIKYGFTLIEIMLVILVVALLMLYAVRIINQSIINGQVSRAASQVNIIKQALLAFYSANGSTWPVNLNNITTPIAANTFNNPSAIPQLVPASALCSPFTAPMASGNCGSNAAYQGTTASTQTYYTLSLQLPSPAIAQALAAAIPNSSATCTGSINPCLTVTIPPPVQVSNVSNHGWIVSAGVISFYNDSKGNGKWNQGSGAAGSQVYLPNCGPNYEGHIIFAPERYETNASGADWGIHLAQVTNLGDKADGSSIGNSAYSILYNTNNKDVYGNTEYAITYGDSPDGNNVFSLMHLAFFMTFCLPIGHWGTHWINNKWPQDAQCSTSWQGYLKGNSHAACSSTDAQLWSIGTPVGSPEGY